MKLALFSDVHGKLRIVLRMLQCWQVQHRTWLDAALLAGDLGCFPDEDRFDKATRRWIERDAEEAGFPHYFMRPHAEITALFAGAAAHGPFSAVRCPLLFVAGNHEDFAYLEHCRKAGPARGMPAHTFPVDCYRRIHCIANGQIVTLRGADGSRLRVGGLWGIENTAPGSPKQISQAAAERLRGAGRHSFDLLLTHDAPAHAYPGHKASRTVSDVLRACEPPLHLFGHAHPVEGRHEFWAEPISTRSWIFEDVGFGKQGKGSLVGVMGVLSWEGAGPDACWSVEVVRGAWAAAMRQRSWLHLWPTAEETAG